MEELLFQKWSKVRFTDKIFKNTSVATFNSLTCCQINTNEKFLKRSLLNFSFSDSLNLDSLLFTSGEQVQQKEIIQWQAFCPNLNLGKSLTYGTVEVIFPSKIRNAITKNLFYKFTRNLLSIFVNLRLDGVLQNKNWPRNASIAKNERKCIGSLTQLYFSTSNHRIFGNQVLRCLRFSAHDRFFRCSVFKGPRHYPRYFSVKTYRKCGAKTSTHIWWLSSIGRSMKRKFYALLKYNWCYSTNLTIHCHLGKLVERWAGFNIQKNAQRFHRITFVETRVRDFIASL